MKSTLKCFLSILVCAVLSFTTFAPALAVSAADTGLVETQFKDPPTDDNSADVKAFKNTMNALAAPVIVDFSTKTTFGQTVRLTAVSPIEQAGKYSFVNVDGVDCMKLEYEPTYSTASISPYRIMFVFHNKNILTANHKYMRVTYMTTDKSGTELQMYCNYPSSATKVLDRDTSENKGRFTRTEAIDITTASGNNILTRFRAGNHNTLQFMSTDAKSEIYIKEVAFFADYRQAYYYYDEPFAMKFGSNGNGALEKGTNYGNASINNKNDALDIGYSEALQNVDAGFKYHYMAKVKFANATALPESHRYVRVLYSAKNPDGCTGASLFLKGDGVGGIYELQADLQDTNGEYVYSDPVYLPKNYIKRLANTSGGCHLSICVNAANDGGEYSVKAIYFFPTLQAAESFVPEVEEESNKGLPTSGIVMMMLLKKKAETGSVKPEEVKINKYEDVAAPVLVDFTSEASYNSVAKLFTDAKQPDIGGKYTFETVDGVGCIKLTYAPEAATTAISPYRIMFQLKNPASITKEHKWMRVTYMTTDRANSSLEMYCNYPSGKVTLDKIDAKRSGKWICTEPTNISVPFANEKGILTRYIGGQHNTLQYVTKSKESEIYIKEVVFFANKDQALEYTGEHYWNDRAEYTALTFKNGGNATIERAPSGADYGNYAVNAENGSLDIGYSATVNFHGYHYLGKPKFIAANAIPENYSFVRVLYSAKNPEGVETVTMNIINDANPSKDNVQVSENIKDTNGEYVLSETAELTPSTVKRFANDGARHCSVCFGGDKEGGEYSIKAIYFFPSKSQAERFGN